MKTILILCAIAFSTVKGDAEATCIGKWTTIDDKTNKEKSIVELYKNDGKLYGKILKLYPRKGRGDNPLCDKCTGEKKGKEILGMQIVWGLKWDGEEWEDGYILDPEKGKTYSAALWVDKKNPNKLNVRGYIGPIFRTQQWNRIVE